MSSVVVRGGCFVVAAGAQVLCGCCERVWRRGAARGGVGEVECGQGWVLRLVGRGGGGGGWRLEGGGVGGGGLSERRAGSRPEEFRLGDRGADREALGSFLGFPHRGGSAAAVVGREHEWCGGLHSGEEA